VVTDRTQTFAILLRQHRLEAGLTQAALAERAALSVRAIQNLEADLGQPQRETARRLADALALTTDHRERFARAAVQAPRRRTATRLSAARASPKGDGREYVAVAGADARRDLIGERKRVTVLFAEICVTGLGADREPDRADRLLEGALRLLIDAAHTWGGTVTRTGGDGLMALFGAPLADEDHAIRACHAALAMREAGRRYAEHVGPECGATVAVRVGLDSGEVAVRTVRNDLYSEYAAVGPAVRVAARLEQLAGDGAILLTRQTLRLVEGHVRVRSLGPVSVSGLAEPIDAFELADAGPPRSRFQVARTRQLTRFVGRDAELEQLRWAQQMAGEGQGQVMAIVGEAGVGKSRLVYEFIRSHGLAGWRVLESASVSYGKATSYRPVIDLLKSYFTIQDRDDLREIREKVTGNLLTLDRSLEPTLPALLALLDVPVDDGAWDALDPRQRRQRTLDAVKRLLLREAREQPLLLILEDLHWIDSETQALLDGLVDSLGAARLLLVVTYRPEYLHGWASKMCYSQLRLDSPPAESTEELLDALSDARPNNLPIQPTALLGRERELAEVRRLFEDGARLVTLTGPGGTGKTRVGLQVAADLLDDFEQRVFLVELAVISDPQLVASTIAQVLGVRDAGSRPIVDTLKEYMRGRSLLLLLDNLEQILPAASVVADLLAGCPGLAVLATSREPLRLRAEHEYAVLPLALPDARQGTTTEVVSRSPAVTLFVQRAQSIRADFALSDENAPAVAEICARLDGLPLAIELAAARVRLLAPQAMVERLERRLPLLTGGARDLPTRQQTLRATIDWSYDLLDEHEHRLVRRLGVFVGGWRLDSAEAVCNADGDLDTLGGLESLVSKSLVRQDADMRGELRFGMLETIREYALERLEESDEATAIRRRHAEHFLALADEAEPMIRSSPYQREWLSRLDSEHDNLRAALTWSQTETGDSEIGLRLAGALFWFWTDRNHVVEGRTWLERALSIARQASTTHRARALCGLGSLARRQGDYETAKVHFQEALDCSREAGDRWGVARTCGDLGMVARQQGDFHRTEVLFGEALERFRVLSDRWGIAWSLGNLGHIKLVAGDLAGAETLYNQSLELSRLQGDQMGIAWSLGNLGHLAISRGDFDAARVSYEERLALYRRLESPDNVPYALGPLAELARRQGDYGQAHAAYQEILTQARLVRDRRRVASGLEGLAVLARAQEDPRRSAVLFGAAEAARAAIGASTRPVQVSLRQIYDQEVSTVRHMLGPEVFEAAWAEGRAMTLEQAVAYALDEQPSA
jgi:predicted ATPase/class 3 adenylate cyclase